MTRFEEETLPRQSFILFQIKSLAVLILNSSPGRAVFAPFFVSKIWPYLKMDETSIHCSSSELSIHSVCFANIVTMALMLATHSPLLPLSSDLPCAILVFFIYSMSWNQGDTKFQSVSWGKVKNEKKKPVTWARIYGSRCLSYFPKPYFLKPYFLKPYLLKTYFLKPKCTRLKLFWPEAYTPKITRLSYLLSVARFSFIYMTGFYFFLLLFFAPFPCINAWNFTDTSLPKGEIHLWDLIFLP